MDDTQITKILKKAVALLATDRMQNARGRRPYANENHGGKLAQAVEAVLLDSTPRIIRLPRLSRPTKSCWLTQTKKWVNEVLHFQEPEKNWEERLLRVSLAIVDDGILVSPSRGADLVLKTGNWTNDFIDWVTTAQVGDKFIRQGIFISKEAEAQVKSLLTNLPSREFGIEIDAAAGLVIVIRLK